MAYKKTWQTGYTQNLQSNHNRHGAQWHFVINILSRAKLVGKDETYVRKE